MQGDEASGTHDLAFHARLIELALQAENAAGPQMHVDRKRGNAVNAQGPDAGRPDTRTAPNHRGNLRGKLRALNRCWDHGGPKSDKETVALKVKHGELDTVFSADLNDTIRTTAPRFYGTFSVECLSDEGISQHRLVWPGQ